jgi:4'-phosphopantetheinyl transferase EntD
VIEALVPPGVATAEAYGDPPGARLLPAEEPVVARAVDKRRREFTTGRHLARQALAALGVAPVPLLPGPRGAPGWPDGTTGSITHCAGYRAAAAAPATAVASVGIDAEPDEPLPAGVLDAIALPAERTMVDRLLAAGPAVCWDRLLFSAKESVYKAWFPLTHRWLDFAEAELELDPDGTYTARLLVPGPVVGGRTVGRFAGRWRCGAGLVATATVVAHA